MYLATVDAPWTSGSEASAGVCVRCATARARSPPSQHHRPLMPWHTPLCTSKQHPLWSAPQPPMTNCHRELRNNGHQCHMPTYLACITDILLAHALPRTCSARALKVGAVDSTSNRCHSQHLQDRACKNRNSVLQAVQYVLVRALLPIIYSNQLAAQDIPRPTGLQYTIGQPP